jgi:tetratricopeptide (TPR) repeat protein
MKCLEKDRSRRYDTANGLARDVERFLKDEPVEARPPSAWYRVRKMARRNRTALTVAGVVAAVVVLGTAVSLWQASIARAERQRAEVAEAKRIEEQAAAEAALVAERRQHALDRAIEEALCGDLEKAHKAIVAAEKAGVAPDRVHWLHGLVHYQRGKFEDAIREFESSIAFKPTVAANAMHSEALFNASLHSGNPLIRYFRSAKPDLDSMTPETAEDYLCRGFTTERLRRWGLIKRGQALDDIDKAIEMRDTAIARAFRAIVACEIAVMDGDLPSAERALADIQQAKLRLSDNKFIRFKSLHAHLQAADMYDETGQSNKRKAALEEAGRDAQELRDLPTLTYVMARVYYFDHIGDREAALKELEWASHQPEMSDLVAQYALALYERGRDAEALRVLDDQLKPNNSEGRMLRIILWAELPEVGPDKAYDRYRKMVASRSEREANGPMWSPYEFNVLMLLGKRKEAADQTVSTSRFLPLTKYLTGDLPEEEFLESARKSRLHPILIHYPVGLVRLSDGDRAGAREHLQKTLVDTKFYAAVLYPYARAYLARMKRDPEWPKWIPVKK